MKILFALYREWAEKVFFAVAPMMQQRNHFYKIVKTPEALLDEVNVEWDVVILLGWSWKVPADVVNNRLVIGMHPSDLPHYAGGSPIQNQILDGVEQTYATLFKLDEKFDEGQIIDKEMIDLRGHLHDVLRNITVASSTLIIRFITNFPNNTYAKQTGEGIKVKRLKPEHSKLPNPMRPVPSQPYPVAIEAMTCKELWNHIRCREDPYPNAYFEDATGKLIIKQVEFEPKT